MAAGGLTTDGLHIPNLAARLPAGWIWKRLDKACLDVIDCTHSTPKIASLGPLMVRSQDIRSGVLLVDQAARVTEETYQERVRRAEPAFGDLVYSREGTYFGIAAEVPKDTRVGLAAELKKALAQYTRADREDTGIPIDQALEVLLEKYEIVQGILHGFDYSPFFTGTASQRVAVIPEAMDFVLQQENGQQRFVQAVTELSKAFALVATHDEAAKLREEVAFFQCLRAQFAKLGSGGDGKGPTKEDLDAAVRQIISKSVASDEVIDIFAAAGMERPDISILSDEFLAEVRDLPHRNLALEVLRKLLSDEIKARSRKNLVQSRSFAEMLDKTIKKYRNRSINAAEVITHLVELAKEMREARQRGEALGLSEDEEASTRPWKSTTVP